MYQIMTTLREFLRYFMRVNIIRFEKEKRKSQGLRFTFLMNGICVTMSRYV